MGNKHAIDVKNLRIRYRTLNKLSGKENFLKLKKNHREVFEAIRGVTFHVNKGDIVGVVGRNGSGKSTLMKAIAGIFSPDEGSICLYDHSVSLLSIGVGFQKNLTGRENILLSGMLLGFSEKEIREKTDGIIEFSELDDFIDKPVKTYSSGMYSKLAFAISVNLKTEILLLDEVLSVGDAKFRKKSLAKMKQLIQNDDCTVLIVSHNSNTIRDLCNTVIWMDNGEIKRIGKQKQVMDEYEAFMQ